MRWAAVVKCPHVEGRYEHELEADSAREAQREVAALAIREEPTGFVVPPSEQSPVDRMALAGDERHVEYVAQFVTVNPIEEE